MDINAIVASLKEKFGDTFDEEKVKALFHGQDMNKFSFNEIVDKIKNSGLVGDLDGDGVKEGFVDELKGKAEQLMGSLGNLFGKK